jgi:hypothetical protein
VVSKDLATGQPEAESFTPFLFAQFFGLKKADFKNE